MSFSGITLLSSTLELDSPWFHMVKRLVLVTTDILSTAGLAAELQLAEGWHSMPIAQVWLLWFESGTVLHLWQRQTSSDVSIDAILLVFRKPSPRYHASSISWLMHNRKEAMPCKFKIWNYNRVHASGKRDVRQLQHLVMMVTMRNLVVPMLKEIDAHLWTGWGQRRLCYRKQTHHT